MIRLQRHRSFRFNRILVIHLPRYIREPDWFPKKIVAIGICKEWGWTGDMSWGRKKKRLRWCIYNSN